MSCLCHLFTAVSWFHPTLSGSPSSFSLPGRRSCLSPLLCTRVCAALRRSCATCAAAPVCCCSASCPRATPALPRCAWCCPRSSPPKVSVARRVTSVVLVWWLVKTRVWCFCLCPLDTSYVAFEKRRVKPLTARPVVPKAIDNGACGGYRAVVTGPTWV